MASDTAKSASQWAQLADPGFAMIRDAEHVETVIIGGGHAGLTMSYFLSQRGREHVILERGRFSTIPASPFTDVGSRVFPGSVSWD
jgi:NAD(P)-binding Rossmann-like domain